MELKRSKKILETPLQGYNAEQLLNLAKQSQSPEREVYELAAAKIFISLDAELKAKNQTLVVTDENTLTNTEYPSAESSNYRNTALDVLSSIDPQNLNLENLVEYSALYTDLALTLNQPSLAVQVAENPALKDKFDNGLLNLDQQQQVLDFQAIVHKVQGNLLKSAKRRLERTDLLATVEARQQNRELLWQTVLAIPVHQLQPLISNEGNPHLRSWLELAFLTQRYQDDLDQLLREVNYWIASNPEHDASLNLPKNLIQLPELIANRPKKVVVLLPGSGRFAGAGKSIRDGILAAYYQAKKHHEYAPELEFLDSESGDLERLFSAAINANADMIVGPLQRQQVEQLASYESLPIATLALNYAFANPEPAKQLFQLGLAIEDEAKLVAERAWLDGHRQILTLYPESNWGERANRAFSDTWLGLGGTLVANHEYSGSRDYSQDIGRALHTENSKTRARSVQQIIGESVEHEPRRRQDIDAIFLAANTAAGRQIKPTLAFHYAGNVTVYSTSQIFDGSPDREQNRDLNGIRFTALPWHLFRSEVKDELSASKNTNNPLYALGIDAFNLIPRLNHMSSVSRGSHFGQTGKLHLNSQRQLRRQPTWAFFSNGDIKSMPMIVDDDR